MSFPLGEMVGGDDLVAAALTLEPIREQAPLHVVIVFAVLPVAKVIVAQPILEELDDVLLRQDFFLADPTHGRSLEHLPFTAFVRANPL